MWVEENSRLEWSRWSLPELAKKIVKSILLIPMN
jgi:hypothetical protein